MQQTRRLFLRATLAAGTVATAAMAGLLIPRTVLAAGWPSKAFAAKEFDTALMEIAGGKSLQPSDQVSIKVPDIAENGAVVSFTVTHSIPNAESISILVPENTAKLAASYQLSSRINSFVTGRIKMRKTSDVIAVVKAGDKLYSAKGRVKVTLGGCGG